MTFTDAERAYLAIQPLGRIATIGPDGAPQVKPVAYTLNGETIDIGGPSLSTGRMYRNLQADPRVAFVVDDNADEPVGPGGQHGRGLEVRGTVELLTLDEPVMFGFSNELIRIRPRRLIAWNLDGPGSNFRDA